MKKSTQYLNGLYESLEQAQPTTISGQHQKATLLNEGRSFMNLNIALGTLLESADDGLNAWANETVSGASLNEKVLVNFNAVLESLVQTTENFDSRLHVTTAETLDYLTTLDGAELTDAIKNGVLDDFKYITEISDIIDVLTEAKITGLNENNKNVIYTPYSMLSESADGKTVIRLKGNNYAIGLDGRLYEAEGAQTGDAVNDAIENIPFNDQDEEWELTSPAGLITVSAKEKCIRMNGNPTDCDKLRESLSDAVVQHADVLTDQDLEYLDDIMLIAQNMGEIQLIDEARICENLVDHGESIVIFPNEHGTEVSVIEDGVLKYGDNIEEIIDHAVENFSVAKSYLTESFKDKLERRALYEELRREKNADIEATRKALNEALIECDNDLALVDADSEAAEAGAELRERIIEALEALPETE